MLEYGSVTGLPDKYRITLAISVALLLHTLVMAALPFASPNLESHRQTVKVELVALAIFLCRNPPPTRHRPAVTSASPLLWNRLKSTPVSPEKGNKPKIRHHHRQQPWWSPNLKHRQRPRGTQAPLPQVTRSSQWKTRRKGSLGLPRPHEMWIPIQQAWPYTLVRNSANDRFLQAAALQSR